VLYINTAGPKFGVGSHQHNFFHALCYSSYCQMQVWAYLCPHTSFIPEIK